MGGRGGVVWGWDEEHGSFHPRKMFRRYVRRNRSVWSVGRLSLHVSTHGDRVCALWVVVPANTVEVPIPARAERALSRGCSCAKHSQQPSDSARGLPSDTVGVFARQFVGCAPCRQCSPRLTARTCFGNCVGQSMLTSCVPCNGLRAGSRLWTCCCRSRVLPLCGRSVCGRSRLVAHTRRISSVVWSLHSGRRASLRRMRVDHRRQLLSLVASAEGCSW